MDPFIAFKYLHIVSMFFAVALALSTELVLRQVAASGDVRAIRTTTARARPLGNIATALFLIGAAFGIVAALTGQINLLATWLILAYVLFIAATAIGILVSDPWLNRLQSAAGDSPEDAPSEMLREVIGEPTARVAVWALMLIVAALVFVMVVKPFA